MIYFYSIEHDASNVCRAAVFVWFILSRFACEGCHIFLFVCGFSHEFIHHWILKHIQKCNAIWKLSPLKYYITDSMLLLCNGNKGMGINKGMGGR